jgi:hypothetical protein
MEKSPSEVMVTLVFLRRVRRGHRRRRCSDGVEEDEAAGVEEEDGVMAMDGGTGGGGALSAWRKTTTGVPGMAVTVSVKPSNT